VADYLRGRSQVVPSSPSNPVEKLKSYERIPSSPRGATPGYGLSQLRTTTAGQGSTVKISCSLGKALWSLNRVTQVEFAGCCGCNWSDTNPLADRLRDCS